MKVKKPPKFLILFSTVMPSVFHASAVDSLTCLQTVSVTIPETSAASANYEIQSYCNSSGIYFTSLKLNFDALT